MSIFDEIRPLAELGEFAVGEVICGDNVRDVKPEFVRDLVDSIRASGELLQPIAVDEEGVLIDGQHRLAAVKELGWEYVPVRIVRGHLDGETRAMLQVMANVTRQEMDIKTASKYYDKYWAFIAADRKRKMLSGVGAVEPSVEMTEGSTAEFDKLSSTGETRHIAAALLGFRKDEVVQYRQLEEIAERGVDDDVRSKASEMLDKVDAGSIAVAPAWKRVQNMQEAHVAGPARVAEAQLAEKSRDALRKVETAAKLLEETNFAEIAMKNFGSDFTMVTFPLARVQLAAMSAMARVLRDADANGVGFQRVSQLTYALDGLKDDLQEFLSANEGEL